MSQIFEADSLLKMKSCLIKKWTHRIVIVNSL